MVEDRPVMMMNERKKEKRIASSAYVASRK